MELDKEINNGVEIIEEENQQSDSNDGSPNLESEQESNPQDVESTTADTPESSTPEALEEEEVVSKEEMTRAIALLQEEIASLNQQLEKEKEESKSVQGQYMRLTADFDNFRRRSSKEKEELENQIKKKTIGELLAVVDNFERARTQIKPANDGEMAIHKSYQGVYKTFVDNLKKLGVSAMRPEGEPFDPNYQEAMLREPTNEYPEGTVLEQLVRGYMLNDDVLRYAMVKVAAPSEDQGESTTTSQPTDES